MLCQRAGSACALACKERPPGEPRDECFVMSAIRLRAIELVADRGEKRLPRRHDPLRRQEAARAWQQAATGAPVKPAPARRVAYAHPWFSTPPAEPCLRRQARLGPMLGRLLPRPSASPAGRPLRDTGSHRGGRGRACAVAPGALIRSGCGLARSTENRVQQPAEAGARRRSDPRALVGVASV